MGPTFFVLCVGGAWCSHSLNGLLGGWGGVGGILNSLVSHWVVSQLQSQRERERESLLCFYAYACLRVSLRILLVSALSLSLILCINYSVKFMRHFIRILLQVLAPSLHHHFLSFYNAIEVIF